MRTIKDVWIVGKYSILTLDAPPENKAFQKYSINGIEYEPVIVYDMPNCIAVINDGRIFKGQKVTFV